MTVNSVAQQRCEERILDPRERLARSRESVEGKKTQFIAVAIVFYSNLNFVTKQSQQSELKLQIEFDIRNAINRNKDKKHLLRELYDIARENQTSELH